MNRLGGARCGTPTGATRHSRNGEKPCDACALAKKEYDKRWRSAPDRTRRSRLHARAQSRAWRLLAERHPAEYRIYYEEAKAELFREAERDVEAAS